MEKQIPRRKASSILVFAVLSLGFFFDTFDILGGSSIANDLQDSLMCHKGFNCISSARNKVLTFDVGYCEIRGSIYTNEHKQCTTAIGAIRVGKNLGISSYS